MQQYSTYNDLGANANDDGTIVSVSTSNPVNTSNVGKYTVTYTATDSSGNQGSATRTVHVVNNTNPIVTMNRADLNPYYIEVSTGTYQEHSATAVDGTGGPALSVSTSGSVNTNVVGTYNIYYTATDSTGKSGQAHRQVIVRDTVAPVITLIGNASVQIEAGNVASYVDAGATVSDASGNAVLSYFNNVDVNSPGGYIATYTATDGYNNATPVSRTVLVVEPNPEITLNGDPTMTVERGSVWTDPGAEVGSSSTTAVEVTGPLGNPVNYTISGNGNIRELAISQDGTRMAVGYTDAHRVKIYELQDSTWTIMNGGDMYKPPVHPETDSRFGSAVSMSNDGNLIAIGATHYPNGWGTRQGRVFVYRWDGTIWTQLGDPITSPYDFSLLGHSGSLQVSGDGTSLFVGDNSYPGSGDYMYQGRVRHFLLSEAGHVELPHIDSPVQTSGANQRFGYRLACTTDGKIVVASMPEYNGKAGAVVVYENTNTVSDPTWVLKGSIIDPPAEWPLNDYSNGAQFGFHGVAINGSDGSVIAISNPLSNNFMVMEWNGSAWVQRGTYLEPHEVDNSTNANKFGHAAVDISDDGTLVAAGNTMDGLGGLTGFARLWLWNGSSFNNIWTQEGSFDGEFYGYSVALSPSAVVAVGLKSTSVQVYEISGGTASPATPVVESNNIMAYYHQKVSPLSNGTLADLGPNGNNGTVSGTIVESPDYLEWTTYNAHIDTGLAFQDILDSNGTGEFTMAIKLQYTGTDTQTWTPIFWGNIGGHEQFWIGKSSGNTSLYMQDFTSGSLSNPGLFDSAGRASPHTLVLTRTGSYSDGFTLRVYIDGVHVHEFAVVGSGATHRIYVGWAGASYEFTGKIWQVIIMDKVLPSEEIQVLHQSMIADEQYLATSSGTAPASVYDPINSSNQTVTIETMMANPDTYTILYSGTAGTATRTVIVQDTVAPVFNTFSDVTHERGQPYSDVKPTAYDPRDTGNVTINTTQNFYNVDPNVVGDYQIDYQASDGYNTTTSRRKNVYVRDTVAPVITLTGDGTFSASPYTWKQGEMTSWTDPGYSAIDQVDNTNLYSSVTVDSSAIDFNTPGNYQVVYTLNNSSYGPAAVQKIRYVKIEASAFPGLTAQKYNGNYQDDRNWFASNQGSKLGASYITTGIELSDQGDNYSYNWTGAFIPHVSGTWQFWTESNDSSHVWIDNLVTGTSTHVVDNGGNHENSGGSEKHIGINIVHQNGHQVTGSAGALPAPNWNNFTDLNITNTALIDSTGADSGATFTSSAPSYYFNSQMHNSLSQDGEHGSMFFAFIDSGFGSTEYTMTISNIPSEFQTQGYELRIYHNADSSGNMGFRVEDGTGYSKTYYSYQEVGHHNYPLSGTDEFGGVSGYIGSQDTSNMTTTPSNYTFFTGLSGSTLTIVRVPGGVHDYRCRPNAFQITTRPAVSSTTTRSGTINVTAETVYGIQVAYEQFTGEAFMRMDYQPPGLSRVYGNNNGGSLLTYGNIFMSDYSLAGGGFTLPVQDGLTAHHSWFSFQDNNTWQDLTGNGHHAIRQGSGTVSLVSEADANITGFGGLGPWPYISGSKDSRWDLFGGQTLNAQYTIVYIMRYDVNASDRQRIIDMKNRNYALGAYSGTIGRSYQEGDLDYNSYMYQTEWVFGIEMPNRQVLRGTVTTQWADNTGGGSDHDLLVATINNGSHSHEHSDYNIAEMIYYNRILTESEINYMKTWLDNYANGQVPLP